MVNYCTFKGHLKFGADSIRQNLQHGIIDWCKWAILDIGGYQNVTMAQSGGMFGGHPSFLLPVMHNKESGYVWEAQRSDWIWETGIEYSGADPIIASGVSVSGTFYPTASTTGTYAHYIDYPNGRVVFANRIPTTLEVKTNYSYRLASFVKAEDPIAQTLMFDSFDVTQDDAPIKMSYARRQMPLVAVEISNRPGYAPYQLGGGQYVLQNITYYIFSEDAFYRDQLTDILANQNDKTIILPGRQLIKSSGTYPVDLDYRGVPVSGAMIYPDIVSNFAWSKVRFTNTSVQNVSTVNHWLYRSMVRTTADMIFEQL